jgi:glucokinase
MFLAGDLGGTKTILGEFEPDPGGLRRVRERVFPSRSYPTFDALAAEFLSGRDGPPLRSACLGVAGTVIDGRCKTTNLPWALDESALSAALGVPRVKLLNDLEATAFGILTLSSDERAVLNPGPAPPGGRRGHVAVIAAGTGLGEAMLYWDGARYHPVASEGGHADFGPRTEREVELWHFLRARHGGHVSYERVLSGPGFHDIYRFLRDECGLEEPPGLAAEVAAGHPNAVISTHGLAGDVPLCAETVAMFVSAYGAEAGNLALRCVAVGGVFLAGGIAPKLLPALRSPAFLDSFRAKGRLAPFLEKVEVSVSLNPEAALLGAAHYAARLGV